MRRIIAGFIADLKYQWTVYVGFMINTKMNENWIGFEMITKMRFKERSTNVNMPSVHVPTVGKGELEKRKTGQKIQRRI